MTSSVSKPFLICYFATIFTTTCMTKQRSLAPLFEAYSNQFSPYFFYLRKIRTIQVEYTDALEFILQAARKTLVQLRVFEFNVTSRLS